MQTPRRYLYFSPNDFTHEHEDSVSSKHFFGDSYQPVEIACLVQQMGVSKARADAFALLLIAVLAGTFIFLGATHTMTVPPGRTTFTGKTMIRYAPWLFLMLSFFSCFRKKSPPTTIGPWLEQHFPGRFSVLNSNLKMLDVMAQFRGEKRALVADNSDTEVQFFLNWEKGIESLGLDTQTVTDACEHAKAETTAAREWSARLQKAGLEKFSVGVVDETMIVQVFGEPSRPVCEKTITAVRKALNDRKDQFPARVFFEIMEPAAYQTEFQAIIPRGHWEVGTGWQRENLILSWRMEPDANTTPVWSVNSESGRCGQYREEAFRQAKVWADKHLPKPFFMDADQMAAYEQTPPNAGGKVPAIGFSFPYFDKDPAGESDSEPRGYVSGVYYPEERIFTEIRKQRDY